MSENFYLKIYAVVLLNNTGISHIGCLLPNCNSQLGRGLVPMVTTQSFSFSLIKESESTLTKSHPKEFPRIELGIYPLIP